MENFVRNSKQNIEKEIERIERQPIAPLDKIKQIIDVIQMSLILLKSAVAEYQFPNPKEEILFFKTWKPQISGLLMIITVPAGRNSTNNILSEETMIFWQTPVSGCWTGILLSLPCMIQVWLKS